MPIKLPKGFTRRKSSGNVLDEIEQAPESSFRVIERSDGPTKAKTFGPNEGRYYRPATAESDNIFAGIEKPLPHNSAWLTVDIRGSGGTHNSTSTTGLYDSSSSARYSSSSTLPSSTDVPIHNDHLTRGIHDLPVPPVPESPLFSLRAAGRTFSFGTRSQRASTPLSQQPQQPSSASSSAARDRAMTASSASTAIPPKLLDSDLSLGANNDDNFSNMFENFGKRKSAILMESASSGDVKPKAYPTSVNNERGVQLAPIIIDRKQPVEPSPYSWDSQTSSNSLIHEKKESDATPRGKTETLAPSRSILSSKPTSPMSPASENSTTSFIPQGDDAEIVRQSILLSSNKNLQPSTSGSPNPNTDEETPLFENDEIMSSAHLATQYEQRLSSTPTVQNKVMTPAQFEHYRQQRELIRRLSDASHSDTSEAENEYEEDEDEVEKSREVARQRRKQEAHLSVYRQQMMKVIGQQVPATTSSDSQSLRPVSERGSISTPNLLARTSTPGLPSIKQDVGKNSDGEDDENVPLGILAAHGFPNKNRPPTRLNVSSSNPNLRVSYSASSGLAANDQGSDPRNSLPVFARNLPRDPYFGASIVNAPNRESLAMSGGAPAFANSPSSTSLPPGGLVGVIANEERARAMRRGSPNAQASGIARPYSVANMSQMNVAGPWNMPGAAPQFQPPPVMTPGEQAQIQISQQMTEIMQVQVQMMQQMMQMQGLSGGQQPQMNPNLLPVPSQPTMTGARPLSTASSFHLPSNPPQVDQRTLSMLDPNMSRWNLNNRPASIHPDAMGRPMTPQGYTPSIAPSERSNVGLASRYRPVSVVGQDSQIPRTSTLTSTLKPWNENQRPKSAAMPSHSQLANRKSTSLATVTVRSISAPSQETLTGKQNPKGAAALDDDDDDEGWADMMKNREKKKSNWKLKKETSALGDLLHMVR
ncbi:hypothetical protein UA08_03919 [Talaromyces atroroseus]|uniref:Uncharacterized protein n=1 Tax=Talaromyces atroroseus TaxID=1441469 RepID=A0A225AVC7_TALAT|nr:hypothetical protein UA08_03919 [Talaromyces atroroseus]OKL61258.1 hypothetical protein UA08_03919 [Talaromyces atroroseus]